MAEIFIVEDNLQHSRRMQQLVLRTGDHRLETYVDAGQALNDLRARIEGRSALPELLILDLNLPENSGHEILRFCKQSGACEKMKIMVVSQRLSEEQAAVCKLMGASTCLDKTTNEDRIEDEIRGLLEKDALEQAG